MPDIIAEKYSRVAINAAETAFVPVFGIQFVPPPRQSGAAGLLDKYVRGVQLGQVLLVFFDQVPEPAKVTDVDDIDLQQRITAQVTLIRPKTRCPGPTTRAALT